MSVKKAARVNKMQSHSSPKPASGEVFKSVVAYIEERRYRLYELAALLRATKERAHGVDADVDTLLDLAIGIASSVNEELDSVSLCRAPGIAEVRL